MWDLFHSIFPLIFISNCRICPPTFPGCGSLGLWLHPHHVHKDFEKGKFEMEMKMNMSNDWWNMQRVRHPTTSKLPLHRRVCHNFSWGCGEKEKNTDEYEYFVVFCISYFYESEISRLWLATAAGPGPVNQPSRSRSELPTSNYPSNWMLCLTLMMTLMNKQTKQTASAACESLSPLLPPTNTMLLHLLRLHLHLRLGLALCVCCLCWPLDDDVCQRANESVCCWGDEKGRDVVRRLRVPLISFITTHKSSWFFIFYILKRRKYTTTAR